MASACEPSLDVLAASPARPMLRSAGTVYGGDRMEYRNLGRTGVKVSPLCLGTMMFGRSTNEQDSIAVIEHALDHGINFIDTANAYSAGASERFVGKALGQGRRAHVVLATKAFFPQDQKDPNARGLSRRHLIEACDASLEASADRLDRSLSAAPPAGGHSDRRDAARARRSRSVKARCATSERACSRRGRASRRCGPRRSSA